MKAKPLTIVFIIAAFFLLPGSAGGETLQIIREFFSIRDELIQIQELFNFEGASATKDIAQFEKASLSTLVFLAKEQRLKELKNKIDIFAKDQSPLPLFYQEKLHSLFLEVQEAFEKARASIPKASKSEKILSKPSVPASIVPLSKKVSKNSKEIASRKKFFHSIGVRTLKPQIKRLKIRRAGVDSTLKNKPAAKSSNSLFSSVTPTVALPHREQKNQSEVTNLLTYSSGPHPQINPITAMRPLSIMIENHKNARPQTGLQEAEVVYEIPVEGGITRFMALFYHVGGIIGPIRSCRDYFIDRALEVNALYVHCGGSPQGYKHLSELKAFSIDEISNGGPFFRDKSKKAPHNLYAKMQNIIYTMDKKHPMQLPYQRLPFLYGSSPTNSRRVNRGVTIKYHGNYSVSYRFNDRNFTYDRSMNNEPHLDRLTLKQISPGTVIIQEAVMKVIDEKGRQDISFIGRGKAYILTAGSIIPVFWKKTAPREFTEFFDEKEKPITFSDKNPIWVQVVDSKIPVVFDPPFSRIGVNSIAAKH